MIVFHVTWLLHFAHDVMSYNRNIAFWTPPPVKHRVTINSIPHHVLVVYGRFYCSGTLVQSKIALTTAGCMVDNNNQKVFIKVGTNSIDGSGQVIPVVDIKIHEYFGYYSRMDNDIAILALKESVHFSESVMKIPLIRSEVTLHPGTTILVSGWGNKNLPQKKSLRLLKSEMEMLKREDCTKTYPDLMSSSNFCVRFEPRRFLCDVGGPASYNDQLVGLLSFGATVDRDPYVAVLTNITYFEKWIKLNTIRFLEKYCVNARSHEPLTSGAEGVVERMLL